MVLWYCLLGFIALFIVSFLFACYSNYVAKCTKVYDGMIYGSTKRKRCETFSMVIFKIFSNVLISNETKAIVITFTDTIGTFFGNLYFNISSQLFFWEKIFFPFLWAFCFLIVLTIWMFFKAVLHGSFLKIFNFKKVFSLIKNHFVNLF